MKRKPSKLKYTDLCIYIDNAVYNRDENNVPISFKELTEEQINTIYYYLYNLIYALAVKKRMFGDKQSYDEFCATMTNRVLLRLLNKKTKFGVETKRFKPIKSILNYVKTCLPFDAIMFRNRTFEEIISFDYNEQDALGAKEYLENEVRKQYEPTEDVILNDLFEDIDKIIRRLVNKTIFRGIEKNNLEISLKLSLLNILTLSNRNKNKLNLLNQIKHWENYIVVWGNNTSLNYYLVRFFIIKLFDILDKEINDEEAYRYLPEQIVQDILDSAFPTYDMNQNEEK